MRTSQTDRRLDRPHSSTFPEFFWLFQSLICCYQRNTKVNCSCHHTSFKPSIDQSKRAQCRWNSLRTADPFVVSRLVSNTYRYLNWKNHSFGALPSLGRAGVNRGWPCCVLLLSTPSDGMSRLKDALFLYYTPKHNDQRNSSVCLFVPIS